LRRGAKRSDRHGNAKASCVYANAQRGVEHYMERKAAGSRTWRSGWEREEDH
jgi:hypothetical protein